HNTVATHSFLSRTHTPPPSTLFPYTTLFRSRGIGAEVMLVPDDVEHGTRRFRPAVTSEARDSELQLELDGVLIRPLSMSAGPDLDRKSTRLNSSHQIISYAVFCLKKKNRKV